MPGKILFGANAPDVVAHRQAMLTGYVSVVQRVLRQHSGPAGPGGSAPIPPTGSWVAHACAAWVAFCAVPSTSFAAAALARAGRVPVSVAGTPASPPCAAPSLPVRGVVRHSPAAARKSAKRVEVEEGRRQVVWGSDGVLQFGAGETFIAGTPQRQPGPRSYKNGAPKLVDPSGPFKVGWWEEEDFPPADHESAAGEDGLGAGAGRGGGERASGVDGALGSVVSKGSLVSQGGRENGKDGGKADLPSTVEHPVLGTVACNGQRSVIEAGGVGGEGRGGERGGRDVAGGGEGQLSLPGIPVLDNGHVAAAGCC